MDSINNIKFICTFTVSIEKPIRNSCNIAKVVLSNGCCVAGPVLAILLLFTRVFKVKKIKGRK